MNTLVDRIMGSKGQFLGALWQRPMKTRKGITAQVFKTVRTVVRAGIDYDNRQVVIDARTSGDAPAVNAGLPWGVWVAFPYLIAHKGESYIRLYPVKDTDGNPRSCKVTYSLDGKRVSRAEIEPLCLASEFTPSGLTACYTLNVRNLKQVKFAKTIQNGLVRPFPSVS